MPEKQEQEGVDKGWAWVIVAAAFFIHFLGAGTIMCFGALYVELLDYFPEPRSITAIIGSVTGFAFSIAGPLSTFISTRYGHRTTVIIGSILTTIGLVVSGFAPNIYFLFVSYGVLVGLGIGLAWISYVVSVSCYFVKKRGIAQALAFSGGGCSYLIFPYMYASLIEAYTWRGAVWILAGLSLNGCVMGALLRPVPIVQRQAGKSGYRSVMKKWTFYVFVFVHFCYHTDMLVFTSILPDHARLTGHSTFNSRLLLSVLGAPIIPVRIVGNLVTDRKFLSPTLYMTLVLIFMAVTSFMMPVYHEFWWEALVSALRGSVMAILVPLGAVACADIFGAERMTAAFGLLVLADGMAGLVGPSLAGFTFDATGSYTTMYVINGSLSVLAVLSMFTVYLYKSGYLGGKRLPVRMNINVDQEEMRLQERNGESSDAKYGTSADVVLVDGRGD